MSRSRLWGSHRLHAAGPRSGLFVRVAYVALLIAPAAGHSGGATFENHGPMKRAAGLLTVALFLTGLLLAAPASASDPRIQLANPGPLELVGYCDFPVLITWTD